MKGERTPDNCYLWSPESTAICLGTKKAIGKNTELKQVLINYKATQDVRTLYCDNLYNFNCSKRPIKQNRTNLSEIRLSAAGECVNAKNLRGKFDGCTYEVLKQLLLVSWGNQVFKFCDSRVPLGPFLKNISRRAKTHYPHQTYCFHKSIAHPLQNLQTLGFSCNTFNIVICVQSKMSQHPSSDFVHASSVNHGSSSSISRDKESLQMINLSDLVLDVVPVSMVYPVLDKEEGPSTAKDDKISSKYSVSSSKTNVEQKYRVGVKTTPTRVSASDKNVSREE